MSANSIFAIKPYLWNGQWVFDDPERELVKEPFVGGTDTIMTIATREIPNAEAGFLMLFSTVKFPGAEIALDWVRAEEGGNTYEWRGQKMEGWLCPALLKFYAEPPKSIYVQVKPITKQS